MVKKKIKQEKPKKRKESLFEIINKWFDNNHSGLIVFLCVVAFMFSMLLFNVRISEGGDDSAYIEAGYNYSKDFFNYHFNFNAPLYPMFLSIPIKIFGINLKILKFTSVCFSLLHLIFLYLAFYKRIPNLLLFPVLFIVSVNSYFHYYASQTYNEAFFLFIQSLFFYSAFNLIEKTENKNDLSGTYKYWLSFGFIAFILALSKNIAVLGVGVIIFYFLIQKNFKNAIYSLVFFLIFRIPFEIFSYLVWTSGVQGGDQLAILMQKDAYNPDKGNEDFAGFVNRFLQNSELYFSRRLMHILNFKNETNNILYHSETIIVGGILLLGLFAIFKSKNKYLLITALYTLPMIAVTFIVVQITWDQPRLILIFVPFMLIIAFFACYYFFEKWRKRFLQLIMVSLVALLIILSVIPSTKKTKENLSVLRKNIDGDMFYGYTPDWMNFLKMSEWCGKNLPDTAFVASRKPSMSFIYSNGKEFYPVYRVLPNMDADSVLMQLKKNKVTHAIVANLRKDKSKVADSTNVINTLHRMLKPVADKYPQALLLRHKIGEQEISYLLELKYPEHITVPEQ